MSLIMFLGRDMYTLLCTNSVCSNFDYYLYADLQFCLALVNFTLTQLSDRLQYIFYWTAN